MATFTEKRYYDNPEEAAKNIKILFLPGRNLQSRELIEIQNIVLSQVSRFGRHVFKEGSPVYGGALSYGETNLVYVDVPSGVDVDVFLNKEVEEKDASGSLTGERAFVKLVGSETNHKYLEVEYISSGEFSPSNRLYVVDTNYYVNIETASDAVRKAQYAHLQNGVFFLDGYFVEVAEQRIVITEGDLASGKLGLLFEKVVITEDEDDGLYDPAFGTYNYSAPGAHRLRYDVKLIFISDTEDVPDNFVEIVRINEGDVETITNNPIYSEIGEVMARRTFAESGDYTIEPFPLSFYEDMNLLAERIEVSSQGSYFVANATTSLPHGLKSGSKVKVEIDGNTDFDGIWTVNDVVDDRTFNFVLPSAPSVSVLDGQEYNIRISDLDRFVVELGAGAAVVKGYSIDKKVATKLWNWRSRETNVQQNHSVGISYGNILYGTNLNGYFRPNEVVTLRNSAGAAIGSAILRYVRIEDTTYSSASKFETSLYNFSFVGSSSIVDVRKIEGQNGSLDVHSDSIDSSGKTFLRGKQFPLIYRVRDWLKTLEPNNVSDTSFYYYSYMTNNSSSGQLSFHLTGNDEFVGQITNFVSSALWRENYLLTDSNGNVVEPTSVVLDASHKVLTITVSTDSAYHLFVKVRRNVAYSKTKTLRQRNLVVPANTFSNGRVSLGIPDVVRVLSIVEGGNDVTSDYILDNGQRDYAYLHASILHKAGVNPSADLLVTIEYFEHSGDGFFSVDSYQGMEIKDIPVYKAFDGTEYRLSDCVDFRPVVPEGATVPVGVVPANNDNLVCDVEYYLPRYDRIVLDSGGVFRVVNGVAKDNPKLPEEPINSMTLYHIYVPPYTLSVDDIKVRYYDNRRYTMKDIGRIDRRLKRVEDTVSLSLLEMRVKQEPIYDANGLERFKNGFIADDFSTPGIGDINNPDFSVAYDFERNEVRPSYEQKHLKLQFNGNLVNGVLMGTEETGYMYGIPYTEEIFIENLNASKSEFVSKYLTTQFIGSMELNPPYDDWYDDTEKDEVIYAKADGETEMLDVQNVWNSWESAWYGIDVSSDASVVSWKDRKLVNVDTAKWMRPIDIMVSVNGLRPNEELFVFVDDKRMDGQITPQVGYEPQSGGMVRSDADGSCQFILHIGKKQFRTGKRLITICDEQSRILRNASTYAKGVFYSTGLVRSFTNTNVVLELPKPQIITYGGYSNYYGWDDGGFSPGPGFDDGSDLSDYSGTAGTVY